MLLELGRRLSSAGRITDPEDIYWLEQAEVEEAAHKVDRGEQLDNLDWLVYQRKVDWRGAKQATPPVSLPQRSFLGKRMGKKEQRTGGMEYTLKGVAASPGKVTARASVLEGPEDFASMQTGDVLVAAITTPAWTPLFARAAAIVTDVGGPLSHGSIVAREYGIPAVLGSGSATKVIRSGQLVTVDGSAGLVRVHDNGDSEA
jgi:pyruvate,water dikinase